MNVSSRNALLTPAEMAIADRLTISSGRPGTSGFELMQRAGYAVWRVVQKHLLSSKRLIILIGPGNNGGDGLIVAGLAEEAGLKPFCFSLVPCSEFSGDAALAAETVAGNLSPVSDYEPQSGDLVVDALFGAGLSKPVGGMAGEKIEEINRQRAQTSTITVIAVDLPSGVNGANGHIDGAAFEADETVTFFLRKPGHLLLPGRERCGSVVCADIGISTGVLDQIRPAHFGLDRAFAAAHISPPDVSGHKYHRGEVYVLSGPEFRTGASRLSALAALGSGAGLVTVCGSEAACREHAAHSTAVMLKPVEDITTLFEDGRPRTVIAGPAFADGDDERCRRRIEEVCEHAAAAVFDADALTLFEGCPDRLFQAVRDKPVVLTPHSGEFHRLFPDISRDLKYRKIAKTEAVRQAAERCGAVVLLKGPDTVVADPGGQVAINTSGTPWLATAGSGDVLAGIIGGRLSGSGDPFEAACLGAWIHGRAGELAGPGLTAGKLVDRIPAVLEELTASGR